MVWAPWMMEKLSRISVRQKTSSTFGSKKNGCPNRKEGTNPIPVSGTATVSESSRGRFSREYVKCASLSFVGETVVNQLALNVCTFAGPSIPFAVVPEVGT